MSRRDTIWKWVFYTAGVLLLLLLQGLALDHISLLHVHPYLPPVMVAVLAMFEGAYGGMGVALAMGLLFDLTQPGLIPCFHILAFLLAALAAACEGESLITGTSRLAHKESDRAETLREEYAKVGIEIDLSTPEALEALVDKWQAEIPGAQVVPTSAKENFNIEGLFRTILSLLPEGPAFYPKDTLTDKTLRFFASEIIREKILKFYDKEIPYCCEIEIESYKEEPAIDRIAATIYVARDSQKGILIGHKGEKLKRVGQAAREDMEQFLGKKVFLQLFVKVNDDWRNNERQLRRFGYESE